MVAADADMSPRMKLRAALGDNAENPIFIETVPRKGYRFIAPVEPCKLETPAITTAIRIEGQTEALEGFEPTDATCSLGAMLDQVLHVTL